MLDKPRKDWSTTNKKYFILLDIFNKSLLQKFSFKQSTNPWKCMFFEVQSFHTVCWPSLTDWSLRKRRQEKDIAKWRPRRCHSGRKCQAGNWRKFGEFREKTKMSFSNLLLFHSFFQSEIFEKFTPKYQTNFAIFRRAFHLHSNAILSTVRKFEENWDAFDQMFAQPLKKPFCPNTAILNRTIWMKESISRRRRLKRKGFYILNSVRMSTVNIHISRTS